MNNQDRKIMEAHGELLARLDERTLNNYHLSEKIEQHMAVQNNKLEEAGKDIHGLKVWRRVIVSIGGAIVAWLIKGEIG